MAPLQDCHINERYASWLNDPFVYQFLETRHCKQTLETIRQFVESVNSNPSEHLFGIFLDGKHIGNIKLGPINSNHPVADVSLFIGDRQSWGMGYATQAIRLVSEFGFDSLGLIKLSAGAYAENIGSIRAFEKAEYQTEGRRRNHYLLDGKPSDIILLGRCRDCINGSL